MYLHSPLQSILITAASVRTIWPLVLFDLERKEKSIHRPNSICHVAHEPVQVLLVIVVLQILSQRVCIAETLNNAVHVTSVTQVLQPGQAALLEEIEMKEISRNVSRKQTKMTKTRKSIFPPLMGFQNCSFSDS